MSRKSAAGSVVRKSADDLPKATSADLDRLRTAMRGRIDTSEIAERRSGPRVARDANGNLPPRKSLIRDAVTDEMRRRKLTAYRLWQIARAHYPTLSQSAVHEFLKGQRQLELPSVEALLVAVNLQVVRGRPARRGHTRTATKRSAAARAG
jgi:hypothetical protein